MTNICLPSTSTIWPLAYQSWIPLGSSFSCRDILCCRHNATNLIHNTLISSIYLLYVVGIFWPLVKPLGPGLEHSWLGVQGDPTTPLKDSFIFSSLLCAVSFIHIMQNVWYRYNFQFHLPTVTSMNLRSRRIMTPASIVLFLSLSVTEQRSVRVTEQRHLLLNWRYVFPSSGRWWWGSCVRPVHRSHTPISGVFEYST